VRNDQQIRNETLRPERHFKDLIYEDLRTRLQHPFSPIHTFIVLITFAIFKLITLFVLEKWRRTEMPLSLVLPLEWPEIWSSDTNSNPKLFLSNVDRLDESFGIPSTRKRGKGAGGYAFDVPSDTASKFMKQRRNFGLRFV
jgi:hypothetical protein